MTGEQLPESPLRDRANVPGMATRRRRLFTLALLALAVAALIALVVANWSRSLLGGVAAVGVGAGLLFVAAIFVWHGDFI